MPIWATFTIYLVLGQVSLLCQFGQLSLGNFHLGNFRSAEKRLVNSYCANRFIWSRTIESATYCDQLPLFLLYTKPCSTQKHRLIESLGHFNHFYVGPK